MPARHAEYKPNQFVMKKLFLVLAAAAIASGAYAEGYQVNNMSAKQTGMGHVGTALKLNSESLHFNPAAAAFQTSKFDISAGITGISSYVRYSNIDYSGENRIKAESDNKISTPMYVYFNYKPTERLGIGVSFTTPFGSAMKWPSNWAGAHLIQDINLTAFQIQPTVSYKICDKLSVGAGLTVAWGNFDLSRSMFPVGAATNNTIAGILTANGMGQYAPLFTNAGDNALLSAKLAGDAQVAVGVNVGIMWDVHEQWTFGFNYRSRLNMKVKKGTAEMNYHSPEIKQVMSATGLIPRLDEGTFNAELPLPTNLTWAVAFRPAEKWEFAVDLQWVGWSAYKELNVSFNEPELKIEDINSVKNYKNTLAFRFGGEYKACDLIQARMGMYVDESPVRSDYLNPETPSMTKLAYTAGLTINPVKCMSIDVAYGYVASADPERTGSYPYFNSLTYGAVYQQALTAGASETEAAASAAKAANQPFSGNYALHAHTFSIGVRFRF